MEEVRSKSEKVHKGRVPVFLNVSTENYRCEVNLATKRDIMAGTKRTPPAELISKIHLKVGDDQRDEVELDEFNKILDKFRSSGREIGKTLSQLSDKIDNLGLTGGGQQHLIHYKRFSGDINGRETLIQVLFFQGGQMGRAKQVKEVQKNLEVLEKNPCELEITSYEEDRDHVFSPDIEETVDSSKLDNIIGQIQN